MMKYPEYAIEVLEQERERLDKSFHRVWGALAPSPERDKIMWYILTAKEKLNLVLEENKR